MCAFLWDIRYLQTCKKKPQLGYGNNDSTKIKPSQSVNWDKTKSSRESNADIPTLQLTWPRRQIRRLDTSCGLPRSLPETEIARRRRRRTLLSGSYPGPRPSAGSGGRCRPAASI